MVFGRKVFAGASDHGQTIAKWLNPFHGRSLVEGQSLVDALSRGRPGTVFAIFYVGAGGSRAFFAAVHDEYQAVVFARMLSRRDARDVIVVDNGGVGDTAIHASFRSGERLEHVPEDVAPASRDL